MGPGRAAEEGGEGERRGATLASGRADKSSFPLRRSTRNWCAEVYQGDMINIATVLPGPRSVNMHVGEGSGPIVEHYGQMHWITNGNA